MAYNTTGSLDKLTCTIYVVFRKRQDGLGWYCWSKNDSNYLDVKLKVFKKDYNRDFHLVKNLTKREADFNHFMRLRNQLVIAAENFGREENLSPVVILTMSKDLGEQRKLADEVVEIVERANKKYCVTPLRYSVDKPENFSAQIRFFFQGKRRMRSFNKMSM